MSQSLLGRQHKRFLRQRNVVFLNDWVSQPDGACFSLTKVPSNPQQPTNKQQIKVVAGKDWKSISSEESQHLMMSIGSRFQAVIDCKGWAVNSLGESASCSHRLSEIAWRPVQGVLHLSHRSLDQYIIYTPHTLQFSHLQRILTRKSCPGGDLLSTKV